MSEVCVRRHKSSAEGMELISEDALAALRTHNLAGALRVLAVTGATALHKVVAERLAELVDGRVGATLVPQLRMPNGSVAYGACDFSEKHEESPFAAHVYLSTEEGVTEEAVLHEATHAVTEELLTAEQDSLTPTQRQARSELELVWKAARSDALVCLRMSRFARA